MAVGKTTVVLIAGLSGSGKSELTRALARQLPHVAVVALDSYYLPLTHMPLEARASVNFDHPDALDWPLIREHVRALSEGRAVDVPVYNFATHDRETRTQRIEPAPFLVVEGLLGLADEELSQMADLRVYVETAPEVCLRRRTERDIAERGRSAECVAAQWKNTVWPMAEKYILPSRQRADLTVSGQADVDSSARAVLGMLVPQ